MNRPPTPPPPYSVLHTGPAALPSVVHSPGDQPTSLLLPPSLQTSPRDAPSPDTLSSPLAPCTEEIEPLPGYRDKAPEEPGIGGLEKRGSRGSTGSNGSSGDLHKEPLLGEEMLHQQQQQQQQSSQAGEKERAGGGRHRHITGDSGIEVCVCGRGSGGGVGGGEGDRGSLEICDPKAELEGLLSAEEQGGSDRSAAVVNGNGGPDDFCEACSHRSDAEGQTGGERRGVESRGASPSPQLQPPVCLLLHTINEQEIPQCTGTESES